MGATTTFIGYIATFQTFICLCIYIAITYMWYWSKSINFTVISQNIRPIVDVGLWRICSGAMNTRGINSNCANIDPLHMPAGVIPGFVHTIRAFMIIAITVNLVAFVLSLLSNACSTEFRGKARGRIALLSSVLNLLANVIVIFCVSFWAAKTMSGRAGYTSWMTAGGIGSGFGTTLQFTIGTCVILGWVFGAIGLTMGIVGIWSWFSTDYEEEDRLDDDDLTGFPTHTTSYYLPSHSQVNSSRKPRMMNQRASYDEAFARQAYEENLVPSKYARPPKSHRSHPSDKYSGRYQPGYQQKGRYGRKGRGGQGTSQPDDPTYV